MKRNCTNFFRKQIAKGFRDNFSSLCRTSIWTLYYFGRWSSTLLVNTLLNKKERLDIQFKGSGQTPYSRNADGRATLGPMLREYLISESMHNLGVPTTRSLAVVKLEKMSSVKQIYKEQY